MNPVQINHQNNSKSPGMELAFGKSFSQIISQVIVELAKFSVQTHFSLKNI
jgi:hypothetical protein